MGQPPAVGKPASSSPRATPTDQVAFGGNSHQGSFPTTPVESPRGPGFGGSFPVASSKAGFSPSSSTPFGGFGLSANWGAGVWAPVPNNSNSTGGNGSGTSDVQVKS